MKMRSLSGTQRSNDRCCLMLAPASSAPVQPIDRLMMVINENSGFAISDRQPVWSQCRIMSVPRPRVSGVGLGDHFTVEQVDGPAGVGGVFGGVGHHHDGGAFAVELLEAFHHL